MLQTKHMLGAPFIAFTPLFVPGVNGRRAYL